MRLTCSGSILLIQPTKLQLEDQEDPVLSPLVYQRMLKPNIQTLVLNSLTSNSVRLALPSLETQDQDQPHQVQLQDAQEEAFPLALVSAHLPQLLPSKLASVFALQDAHLLKNS